MRVLIVNVNSHTGSTGKIAYGLLNHLRRGGHEALLCCRGVKEETIDDNDVIKICSKAELHLSAFMSKLTGNEGCFNYRSTKNLIRIIEVFQPDIVQLYNLHGYYVGHFNLLHYLKKNNIPVVYSMLDEYPYMGKCTFPIDCDKFKTECRDCPHLDMYPDSWFLDNSSKMFKRKKSLYEGFRNIVFTGPPYVCKRAKESALLHRMEVMPLDEPIDFDKVFYPRDTESLRKELGIGEHEVVILTAVSASSPRKGGQYFVEIARRMNDIPNIRFIYIGYNRTDWTFSKNVIVKGYVKSQSLMAEYFSLADLYVCTSLGDTTPNVCMNALGCGTPLAGFNDGGIVDCAPNEFGHFVKKLDLDALIDIIKGTRKKSQEESKKIRKYAYNRFSQDIIYKKQIEIYNRLTNSSNNMIPFNKPYCSGRELKYIEEVCHSTTMSGNGAFTKKCHHFFEEKYGFKKVLLCTSGTDALEMCAMLCNLKSGDEVIVPSYTFVSTALAFLREGAKVVFADSGKDNPNITLADIEPLVTPRTKVIAVVHYAGVACDMDAIMQFANERGILVVEDAAHSIDSYYKDKPLGGIGHLGAFSFHETKNISSGEGGMLVVNDERFIRRAEIIWEKGTNRAEFYRGMVNKYGWCDMGSSFLPSELNAAYLWAQLEQMDDIQGKRLNIWNTYDKALRGNLKNGIELPELPEYATNNAHMYYLLCPSLEYRTAFMNYLKENGVMPTFHYLPLHSSAYYKDKHDGRELPNCDRYGDTLVRLPLYYELSLEDAERIGKLIAGFAYSSEAQKLNGGGV